ncbi:MAG TPA: NADH-quinone oxidoreductase subunit NuoK [Armatimonadota bacterium]|nr:NADH-quinone oxidoreductase subunit NuoK [Armatimonadota bacterium]HOS43549.1 NADH-quinone oxidoreductase subunit NuoK [Armatimonadota bacterium]
MFSITGLLTISGILFVAGAAALITRRNAVAALMGVELMLNAANLNFVAGWRYFWPERLDAHVAVLLVITVAAAEAAVGLAIILNLYRKFGTVDLEQIRLMRG